MLTHSGASGGGNMIRELTANKPVVTYTAAELIMVQTTQLCSNSSVCLTYYRINDVRLFGGVWNPPLPFVIKNHILADISSITFFLLYPHSNSITMYKLSS